MKILNAFLFLLTGGLLLVTSCQNSAEQEAPTDLAALQKPYTKQARSLELITIQEGFHPIDVRNEKIEAFLGNRFQQVASRLTPDSRRYAYNMVDLNLDGKKEYLVALPGAFFCTEGCTLVVLTENGAGELTEVTTVKGVSYPAFVTGNLSNNWLDLMVYYNGAFRILPSDGNTYPPSSGQQPARILVSEIEVTEYLTDAFKTQLQFQVEATPTQGASSYRGLFYKRGDVFEFRDCDSNKFYQLMDKENTRLGKLSTSLETAASGSLYLEIEGETVATKGTIAKDYPESIQIYNITVMQDGKPGLCDNPKLGGK